MSFEPTPVVCVVCEAPLPSQPEIRGHDRFHDVPGEHAVFICARCGTGVTAPVVPSEALGAFYPSDYAPHRAAEVSLAGRATEAFLRLRIARMLRTMPLGALRGRRPGRVLDVGCGRGDLGAGLIARGFTVAGVDLSPAACRQASGRGLEVQCGTLESAPFAGGSFEAVIFQQSLEHVADPVADVSRARALLRDGGLVIVSVPNFGCWQRRRFGTHWFGLELPRHRTHFTEQSLRLALERAGLRVEQVTTSTLLTGLPASLQYRVFGRWRVGTGAGFQMLAAVSLGLLPVTAGLDAIAGGGELLHAVARS